MKTHTLFLISIFAIFAGISAFNTNADLKIQENEAKSLLRQKRGWGDMFGSSNDDDDDDDYGDATDATTTANSDDDNATREEIRMEERLKERERNNNRNRGRKNDDDDDDDDKKKPDVDWLQLLLGIFNLVKSSGVLD